MVLWQKGQTVRLGGAAVPGGAGLGGAAAGGAVQRRRGGPVLGGRGPRRFPPGTETCDFLGQSQKLRQRASQLLIGSATVNNQSGARSAP